MDPTGDANHVVNADTVRTVLQTGSVGNVTFHQPDPVGVTPSQLPPAAPHFVRRRTELAMLSSLAEQARTGQRPVVAVVTGMAGVGKTATCVWWGHQHRAEFDGGQLYADVDDYRSRGVVDVAAVLSAFLRALGVHRIPDDLPERSAMFRTQTTARRILILLDNVQQPAQVRPLLPGSGGSMVLVTSRGRLGGLLVDGASLVSLKPLDPSDGSLVVSRMLSAGQCADGKALTELVRLCGGLPIALRVAAARLMGGQERSLAKLVSYLSDEQSRMSRLSLEDYKVRTVFDAAYKDLPEQVRDVYHVVGTHPGTDFDPYVIASAVDVDHEVADELLGALCEANLLEELPDGRYRPHDLVRLHARLRAEDPARQSEWERAARRIVEWYLRCAVAADIAVLGRERWRLAYPDTASVPFEFDAPGGMMWLEKERANLLAVVLLAARQGWHDCVWQLIEALWAFYYGRKQDADWAETADLGARAAGQAKHSVAEARSYCYAARAEIELGHFDRATTALEAAQAAADRSTDDRAVATVAESWGVLHRQQGRLADAIADFRRSYQLNKAVGMTRGMALQLYHVADVLVRDGQPREALEELAEATKIFRQLGDELAEARSHIVRGRALHALGRDEEAAVSLDAGVKAMRARRQSIKEQQALEALLEVLT